MGNRAALRSAVMPGKQRAVLLLLALAAVIAAVIFIPSLSDSGEDSGDDTVAAQAQPETTTSGATTTTVAPPERKRAPAETISVRDGKPVGGVQRLSYEKGQTVNLIVKSDVSDEIHIHGFDLKKNVRAGGRVSFSFKAKADGIYEIELEGRKQQLAKLRVNP